MDDPLDRFVAAQRDAYVGALDELERGRKQGHWIWYIFPQMAGLGMSPTSQYYGIASADEARRYLEHPLLGPRLGACVAAVMRHAGAIDAQAMLGPVDAMKLRSSMTLFDAVAEADDRRFAAALEAFYGDERDPATLELLAGEWR